MNMIIGKKQIIMAALVAALGLGVFANWYYVGLDGKESEQAVAVDESVMNETDNNEIQNAAKTEEYFESAKLKKMTARDEAVETLQTVIDACDSSSDAAINAVEELNNLNTCFLLETDIENLVSASIGGECLCTIDQNGIEVIVADDLLSDETVLVISDIINTNCGNVENIRITGA